jgi:D-alanyl-D-alanine dipeptidase
VLGNTMSTDASTKCRARPFDDHLRHKFSDMIKTSKVTSGVIVAIMAGVTACSPASLGQGPPLPGLPAASSTASAPSVNTDELPIAPDRAADSLLADVRVAAPDIRVGLRYATSDNFTGAVLPGYEANRAFLRREAAAALARVARRAADEGLALYVYDAYRPVRATLAMVEWARRTGREDLFRDGYIASRSRHNLGLAIDLTLVDARTGVPLDMGTPFDTFSPSAHTANAVGDVLARRLRLKRLMEAEGFVNYDQEWWHYTLSVPTPLRFDRVIR